MTNPHESRAQSPIADAKLVEMLEGLEGVTPGPWEVGRQGDYGNPDPKAWASFTPIHGKGWGAFASIVTKMDMEYDSKQGRKNAAHIARCDPDTIRPLILELQSLRSASGEVVAWRRPVFKGFESRVTEWKETADQWEADGFPVTPLYAHPVQGVGVKPLEWQLIGPVGSDLLAETVIGEYTINRDNLSAGGAYNLWVAGADDDTFADYATLAEAKDAAQADFNTRIRSALTSGKE